MPALDSQPATDDSEAEDKTEAPDEPEYSFPGFKIEFSERIALMPATLKNAQGQS